MDTIKELWNELKERVTNPFYGSFVISWLLINYPIPITLIFYKQENLRPEYTSFLDVITKNIDGWNMIYVPLLIAMLYTFAFPYFKSYVKVYLTEITLDTDKRIQEKSDTRTVPLSRFSSTKIMLKQRESELADLINDEGAIAAENLTLKNQVHTFEASLITKNTENDRRVADINKAHDDRISQLTNDNKDRIEALENHFKLVETDLNDKLDTMRANLLKKTEEHKSIKFANEENIVKLREAIVLRDAVREKNKDLTQTTEKISQSNSELNGIIKSQSTEIDNLRQHADSKELMFRDGRSATRLDYQEIKHLSRGSSVYTHRYGWGIVKAESEAGSLIISFEGETVLVPVDYKYVYKLA